MSDNHRIPTERTQKERNLNDWEIKKLEEQNSRLVTPFVAKKLETESHKYWDQFYKRNKTHFFKDRHWTTSEFSELLGDSLVGKCLLEVGCGVGNLVFPLLEENTSLQIYACDFSKRAIDFVKANPLFDSSRIFAFVADLTVTNLRKEIGGVFVDIVTLIFILSAISPEKHQRAVENVFDCMNSDGVVLFRDYAINDMTQIRFKPGHKIFENFYMRQDGTRTFFFTVDYVKTLFENAGFLPIECCYVHCRTVNKKEGVDVPRTFVQAKFKKPS